MIICSSRHNPLFKQLKHWLKHTAAAKAAQVVILEGDHVIATILMPHTTPKNCRVQQLIVDASRLSETAVADCLQAAEMQGIAVVYLSTERYQELSQIPSAPSLMAVASVADDRLPDMACDTVLLDNIQDPGNLGTILRSAVAAGYRQVILSPGSAYVWSPKVLRSAQGAHFHLDLFSDYALAEFIAAFQGMTVATAPNASLSLYQMAQSTAPIAWLFGSEGQGISDELLAMVDLRIKIPMQPTMESLNVAMAATLCLFEKVRSTQ